MGSVGGLSPTKITSKGNPLTLIGKEIKVNDKAVDFSGNTKDYQFVDYYTLRKRSVSLFKSNPYCRGVIRRLLRNEIGTGLNLESSPIAERIGMDDDQIQEWATDREIDHTICQRRRNYATGKSRKILANSQPMPE